MAEANLSAVATVMDGKALAGAIRARGRRGGRRARRVGLATVLVGDDPASEIYIRLKHKAASEVGIARGGHPSARDTTAGGRSLHASSSLNGDEEIDGMLVQLPLPAHLDEAR